ncbi:MAG TPA: hypothetical protein VFG10_09740 [Saprospiraceae bacterium]|nr:hypothetical protein [Saprospiraceae bacterium]
MTFQELKIASYLMNVVSNGDRNYDALSNRNLDLNSKDDTKQLLTFLNAWGCRQFIKEQHSQTGKHLKSWFNKFESSLPPHSASLINHSNRKIALYSDMFDVLMNSRASINKTEVNKNVGPVGAAKALFALRRNVFPPWDNPIADHLGFSKNGTGYTEYLMYVRDEILKLKGECAKLKIDLNDIPRIFKRPNVTLVKLIDEYLWLTITRAFDPKAIIDLIK